MNFRVGVPVVEINGAVFRHTPAYGVVITKYVDGVRELTIKSKIPLDTTPRYIRLILPQDSRGFISTREYIVNGYNVVGTQGEFTHHFFVSDELINAPPRGRALPNLVKRFKEILLS